MGTHPTDDAPRCWRLRGGAARTPPLRAAPTWHERLHACRSASRAQRRSSARTRAHRLSYPEAGRVASRRRLERLRDAAQCGATYAQHRASSPETEKRKQKRRAARRSRQRMGEAARRGRQARATRRGASAATGAPVRLHSLVARAPACTPSGSPVQRHSRSLVPNRCVQLPRSAV